MNNNKTTTLSQSQMGIYVESIQHPNELVYHMPFLYTLDKAIDLERLRDALYKVIAAHPAFFSYYTTDDSGEPLIEERKDLPIVIEINEVENMEAVKHDISKRFNLADSRPIHIALYSCKEHNYMLFEVHHIISDGASASVLMNEIDRAYNGEDIEPEDYTFYDVTAEELRLRAGSEEYEAARLWYEQNFNIGDVDTQIIADRNEKEAAVVHAEYNLNIDKENIRHLIESTEVKAGTLFTSAFALLMSKFTGDEQVLFSTIWHGRSDKRMARTMGMFVKTLPVHYAFHRGMTLAELFAHGDKIIKGARKHSVFSYADANASLGIKSNYLFVYQGYLFNNITIGGYPVTMEDLEESATTEPLSIQIYQERDGGYRAVVEYFSHLYSEALVAQLIESFEAILNSMRDGTQSIDELSYITPRQEMLLDSFNATERAYDASQTVLSYFAKHVTANPNHLAVVYKDKKYTYKEVDELSNKIAHRINNYGLGRGDVVAVLIPRSEWMMIASLGVLKAGCGYEPLDPSYPNERLQFMTKDASVRMIIADKDLLSTIELDIENVLFTDDIITLDEPTTTPNIEVRPDDLFIMLYTSGSTGVPKGCMLEHRNILSFELSHTQICGINSDSRVTAYASYGFDASMMETYSAVVSGATLHIIAEEIRLDFVALNEYFIKHKITTSFMTTQVGFQFASACESPYLKALVVGGEKLAPIDPPKTFSLFNAYGPTECCVYTNIYKVTKYEDNIPIGKAVPNVKLYVVDANGKRVPAGAVGELWVAGTQVSRGYLNRDEQTAKVFTSNPFNDDILYNKVYHTGDIVRYLTDGNIQFVGRRDGQVKIRGFRIELKEIEAIIRQYPDINDVTVQAFEEEGGGKFVAAYIVSDKTIDINALNDFILENKPPYLVPAVTMQIERIPLNQNQKVDKRALPKPERKVENIESDVNVPMNVLEKELHDMIADVIKTDQFGITTPLVYVGLTSIASIKLTTQIYKRYGIDIDSKILLKGGSLQSVENAIIERLLSAKDDANVNKNKEEDVETIDSAPLSYAQMGVYYECMKHPLDTTYNIPYSLHFPVGTDIQNLTKAIRHLVAIHPELDIRFESSDAGVVQVRGNYGEAKVEYMNTDDAELQKMKDNFVHPFVIGKEPLYRFRIVQTESGVHLLADIHHLVADGYSLDLFNRQLCTLLEGGNIDNESYDYLNFVHEQQRNEDSEAFASAKNFFDESLDECEGCSELPADFKNDETKGRSQRICLPFDFNSVEKFSREIGVTPAHTMLAVADYALSRYTNNRHIYIATVSNGRSNLRIADTVGMFVNTLALHSHIKEQSVEEFIRAVSDNFDGAIRNENYPFARIATDYNFAFATNYAYQIGVMTEYNVDGKTVAMGELKLDVPKQKLDIMITEVDGSAVIQLQYNDAIYSEDSILRFGKSMLAVLDNFMADRHRNLLQISMIDDDAARELMSLREVASGEAPFPLFHKAVEHWAANKAEAEALVAVDGSYSYAEMNNAMNRIAHALIRRGVGVGSRVALLLPRTSRLILSMFGVMKAGAAYIPCDPDYPADRVRLILEDSEADFVITTEEHLDDFDAGRALDVELLLQENDESNPNIDITPDDLAYLIYTSGSTGRPKGVMLHHRGICNYLYGHPANVFAHAVMTDANRLLSVTTISFDAALQDIGTAMYSGKTLVVATEEQANNPIELASLIKEKGINMVSGTPSRWQTWLTNDDFAQAISNIHIVRAGGEKFPTQLLEQLKDITKARIFNCYGPTEITVASNNAELTDAKIVTVGRPQLNVREFIVDQDGNELPVGVVGELYIGGAGVAKGYNNLDEMTRERFIEYQGERIYRSGDYAKWLPDGNVMILGRTDNQIKLRGLRIELGEIENVIHNVEGIDKVVILIRKINGREHLSAYYTADREINAADLKAEISMSLTQYMVPTAYLQLSEMPMTPNGKTDIKALPEPELSSNNQYEEPANDIERTFCNIFSSILQLEKVGATDNFFELGGTSLVVTRVIIEADKANLHVSYGEVFENPTPRKLARLLSPDNDDILADATITDYDYTSINKALEANTLDSFHNGKEQTLGNVLITGATGYLGIHIIHELLSSDAEKIYCLVRGRDKENAESRLKTLLFYYFDSTFEEIIGERLNIITGDVTDDFTSLLEGIKIDTIFNCAAIVKHFAEGTEIEDVNIGGAERCVEYCLSHDARLIHISTASTRGLSIDNVPTSTQVFNEQTLYLGQYLGNKYIYSKFIAERIILEAIATRGLSAKIMRVGNLAARSTDGEFQVNFSTNSFMGRIKVFNMLGCCPHEMRDNPAEFSPINEVSHAIVLLSKTPSECCVFHPYNNHQVLFGDVLSELKYVGDGVEFVNGDEFARRMELAKEDPDKARQLSSLLAYQDMAHGHKTADVARQNNYTMQVLYRLGYQWSHTTWDYIDRFLKAIAGMGFFDNK